MVLSFKERLDAALDMWIREKASSTISGIISVFKDGFSANIVMAPSDIEINAYVNKIIGKNRLDFSEEDRQLGAKIWDAIIWVRSYVDAQQEVPVC